MSFVNSEDNAAVDINRIPELAADRQENVSRQPPAATAGRPWNVDGDTQSAAVAGQNPLFADDGTDFRFRVRRPRPARWVVAALLLLAAAAFAGQGWFPRDRQPLARHSPVTHTKTQKTPKARPESKPSQVSDMLDTEQMENSLTEAIGNVETYRSRLADYAERVSNAALRESFEAVLEEDLVATAHLENGHQLLDRWHTLDMRLLSPEEATRCLDEAERLLEAVPEMPAAESIRERCKVLRAIAARVDESKDPILAPLLTELKQPVFTAPLLLQTKRGKRYYLTRKPDVTTAVLTCEYVADRSGTIKTCEIAQAELDRAACGSSPLLELATKLRRLLENRDELCWESMFFRTFVAAESQERLDPLVKAQWLQRLLSTGCRGSYVLQQGFQKQRQLLDALPLNQEINWLDPENSVAERLRAQCGEILQRLPDFNTSGGAVARLHADLASFEVPARLVWIGRLARREDGGWQYLLGAAHAQYVGDLFVLHRTDDGTHFHVRQLGAVERGDCVLPSERSSLFREARPVWAILAEKP